MAGNAVIPQAPGADAATGERIVEALASAGLPDGLPQCVQVDHAGNRRR